MSAIEEKIWLLRKVEACSLSYQGKVSHQEKVLSKGFRMRVVPLKSVKRLGRNISFNKTQKN
jgi:hypothetical protein